MKSSVSNLVVNPFAPPPKTIQTPLVSGGDIYDPLIPRALAIAEDSDIVESIEKLRQRLGGQCYEQKHFGRLELLAGNLISTTCPRLPLCNSSKRATIGSTSFSNSELSLTWATL